MNIGFYDTKPYDRIWFEPLSAEYGFDIKFYEYKLNVDTATHCQGFDVVCAFVNDQIDKEVAARLAKAGVSLIALRCAGYNHVDLKAIWKQGLRVVRVPSYSPAAVAEHAAALLLAVNRKTHRAYLRTRDNNFSIHGLMGMDLRGKTAGIIGTGRIGKMFGEILQGFGMEILAYDAKPDPEAGFAYVKLDDLYEQSDVISLHCPLTPDTRYIIGEKRIGQMKDGIILLNTSRGELIDTDALLEGLKSGKIGAAGLDVYEEEEAYFFEDHSEEIVVDDDLSRLLSFPNVLITSHQAFFTKEAMQAIATTTLDSIADFEAEKPLKHELLPQKHEKNN